MDYRALINKPKTKRGRETLNRILSAAAQVFYEKGYHGSSISDITGLAGVVSGTFYVYFDSKYNLYKFLLYQCSHMIRKALHQATANSKSRREAEELGLRAWLEFVQNNRYVYRLIWESLYIDKQLFMGYYEDFSQAYIRRIEAAKRAGEIRPEINSEVLAYTLMGASNFLGLNWGLFKERSADLHDVADGFMNILNGGIFTDGERIAPEPASQPIRIEIEFDDAELEEEEEDGEQSKSASAPQ